MSDTKLAKTNNVTALLEPQTLDDLMRFSEWLAKSALLPRALFGKPADIAIIIMKGRDLGISAMQAIGGINVIEGKAEANGELTVALCLRHPEICEYFKCTLTTKEKATYVAKRRGCEPQEQSFTTEDAHRANLLGRDGWKKYPQNMLRWRASQNLAKQVFPDLVLGMVTPDEAEEIRESKPAAVIPLDPQPLPVPEKPAKASVTEKIKKQLQAKGHKVIDVKKHETEEQATERYDSQTGEVFDIEPPPPSDDDFIPRR